MLNIICCADQTTGSEYMMQCIARDVTQQRENIVLLVPDHASFDAERRLCAVAGDTASRFAQVLTFELLARRIAEDACAGMGDCLDNGGRLVAMAAAARKLHSQLKTFAAVETKPEFLSSMVDAVDEFKRCCITSADLSNAAENSHGMLAEKLKELSLLLDTYDAVCAAGQKDPRDFLTWVLPLIDNASISGSAHLYIDGFQDFSRQNLNMLQHLLECGAKLDICITCPHPDCADMAFELPVTTVKRLKTIARECAMKAQVQILPPKRTPILPVLEQLFQGPVQPVQADTLRALQADSIHQEVQAVARDICGHVQSGARYNEIAVVCSDAASYIPTLRMVFDHCQIPLYVAGTDEVLQFGVVATVFAALEAALSGLELRDMLHYFRSTLSPLSLVECDQLESYALIWNISGKRWNEDWTGHPDGLSGHWNDHTRQRLQCINALRQKTVEPLQLLRSKLHNADCVHQQVQALSEFLEQIQYRQRLQQLAEDFQRTGQLRSAQIMNQLWNILVGALEQLNGVLGTESWDAEQFLRLLRLLLSQYKVGTVPPTLDSVTVGPVSAMRCHREKYLYILGADEGKLPAYNSGEGLLNDYERGLLRNMGLPLMGGGLEGLQAEYAAIYGVFCGAAQKITVSCCSAQPSFLFRRIADMTGHISQTPASDVPVSRRSMDIAAFLAGHEEVQAAQELGIRTEYDRMLSALHHSLGALSRESVEKLYGTSLQLSASQVDSQAGCRLAYFLRYGLHTRERKTATVDPAEFGTYVHEVLERTVADVMGLGGFHQVDLETTLTIAQEHSQTYAQEHFSQLDTQRLEYLFNRNVQELRMVVQELWRELSQSDYVPIRQELSFGIDGEMPPVRIHGGKIPAKLRGFVDRVDLWQKDQRHYFRVVDYKTGKKDFDYCDIFNGVGLQMLLYMFALEEQGSGIIGECPIGAGVQYFPARVAYIPADGPDDPQWEKKRQKQWVRKGLLLDDDGSIAAMDPSEKLDTLSCKYNKDGHLTGDIATKPQMDQLRHYVMRLLARLVDDIADGNITPNPYTRGEQQGACTYCPYGTICHKEQVEDRRNYQAMSAQRFWEEVEKEVCSHG